MDFSETLKQCEKDKNTIYYTPSSLAEALVRRIDFDTAKVALDPCSGTGAFYRAFPKWIAKEECEISQDKGNFFDWNVPVCWIISNPPFSDLTKWIEHTCKYATIGFAYLIPTYALSFQRLKLIESWGFYCKEMTIIDNPKEWGGIGFPMAFYIFEKNGERNVRLNQEKEPIQATLESWTRNQGVGVQ